MCSLRERICFTSTSASSMEPSAKARTRSCDSIPTPSSANATLASFRVSYAVGCCGFSSAPACSTHRRPSILVGGSPRVHHCKRICRCCGARGCASVAIECLPLSSSLHEIGQAYSLEIRVLRSKRRAAILNCSGDGFESLGDGPPTLRGIFELFTELDQCSVGRVHALCQNHRDIEGRHRIDM